MKKTLFIFNGVTKNNGKVGISGGESRMFEIIKNNKDLEVNLLTTTNGLELVEKSRIPYQNKYLINYCVDSTIKSNLTISLKSFFRLPKELKKYNGVVYSSCEHLYDILPAFRLKIFNKCKWIALYHWAEDYPWKDKRGGVPFLRRYIYWFNRLFSGLLIKMFSDQILAVSGQTRDKLIKIKKINPRKIRAVYCGVEYQRITNTLEKYKDEKESKYDAVFMKRLGYGKGVFDLLKYL